MQRNQAINRLTQLAVNKDEQIGEFIIELSSKYINPKDELDSSDCAKLIKLSSKYINAEDELNPGACLQIFFMELDAWDALEKRLKLDELQSLLEVYTQDRLLPRLMTALREKPEQAERALTAAISGLNVKMVKSLIDEKVDVTVRLESERNFLHHLILAASHQKTTAAVPIFEMLFARHPRDMLEEQDAAGRTPLVCALASTVGLDLLSALIKAGASFYASNKEQGTAGVLEPSKIVRVITAKAETHTFGRIVLDHIASVSTLLLLSEQRSLKSSRLKALDVDVLKNHLKKVIVLFIDVKDQMRFKIGLSEMAQSFDCNICEFIASLWSKKEVAENQVLVGFFQHLNKRIDILSQEKYAFYHKQFSEIDKFDQKSDGNALIHADFKTAQCSALIDVIDTTFHERRMGKIGNAMKCLHLLLFQFSPNLRYRELIAEGIREVLHRVLIKVVENRAINLLLVLLEIFRDDQVLCGIATQMISQGWESFPNMKNSGSYEDWQKGLLCAQLLLPFATIPKHTILTESAAKLPQNHPTTLVEDELSRRERTFVLDYSKHTAFVDDLTNLADQYKKSVKNVLSVQVPDQKGSGEPSPLVKLWAACKERAKEHSAAVTQTMVVLHSLLEKSNATAIRIALAGCASVFDMKSAEIFMPLFCELLRISPDLLPNSKQVWPAFRYSQVEVFACIESDIAQFRKFLKKHPTEAILFEKARGLVTLSQKAPLKFLSKPAVTAGGAISQPHKAMSNRAGQ